jgi:hypothetical protein
MPELEQGRDPITGLRGPTPEQTRLPSPEDHVVISPQGVITTSQVGPSPKPAWASLLESPNTAVMSTYQAQSAPAAPLAGPGRTQAGNILSSFATRSPISPTSVPKTVPATSGGRQPIAPQPTAPQPTTPHPVASGPGAPKGSVPTREPSGGVPSLSNAAVARQGAGVAEPGALTGANGAPQAAAGPVPVAAAVVTGTTPPAGKPQRGVKFLRSAKGAIPAADAVTGGSGGSVDGGAQATANRSATAASAARALSSLAGQSVRSAKQGAGKDNQGATQVTPSQAAPGQVATNAGAPAAEVPSVAPSGVHDPRNDDILPTTKSRGFLRFRLR